MNTCPVAPKRVFVFGATSLLGSSIVASTGSALELTPFCSRRARLPAGTCWSRLDLEDDDALARLFERTQPELLIHCGAVCDVDKCEADPSFAYRVNVVSIEHLLRRLPQETRLVYCSSDHVFGAGGALGLTEAAPTAPISQYGKMRVAAEQRVLDRAGSLVLRCSLAIGDSLRGRDGHLDWLRYRTRRGLPMTIVRDEWRSACWATDLAQRVLALAQAELTGLRHVCAARSVSRLELATYLDQRYELGASFKVEGRDEQPAPHLGRIELATVHGDQLAARLPAVVPLGSV